MEELIITFSFDFLKFCIFDHRHQLLVIIIIFSYFYCCLYYLLINFQQSYIIILVLFNLINHPILNLILPSFPPSVIILIII